MVVELDFNGILDAMGDVPGFDFGPANTASAESLREAYGGCGPDRWPQDIRDRLDENTILYAPAIVVHDLEFFESNCDYDRMHEANERFHKNNRAIFRHAYPFWTWRMFRHSYRLARAKAFAIMAALNIATSDVFTRKAWKDSFVAKENREYGASKHC